MQASVHIFYEKLNKQRGVTHYGIYLFQNVSVTVT